MNLTFGDATQSTNAPKPEPTPIFKVVPSVVPTPVPSSEPADTVKLSQAAEIQLLQSQGEDQTQIDTKLGLSVAIPEPGTPGLPAKD